jgi:murein DD-endopeptidase MepM/ murein hydrolase activator NlpD
VILLFFKKLFSFRASPPYGVALFSFSENSALLSELAQYWNLKTKSQKRILHIQIDIEKPETSPSEWFIQKDFGLDLLKKQFEQKQAQNSEGTPILNWTLFAPISPSESEIELFLFHLHLCQTYCPFLILQLDKKCVDWKEILEPHFIEYKANDTLQTANRAQQIQEKIWSKHLATNGTWRKIFKNSIFVVISLFIVFLATLFSPVYLGRDISRQIDTEHFETKNTDYTVTDAFHLKKQAKALLFEAKYAFYPETILDQYLKQTLNRSDIDLSHLEKLKYPLTFKAKFPKLKINKLSEQDYNAYRFWASYLSDSLAYPTDFWWRGNSSIHRPHDGIDFGAAFGSRILSPMRGIIRFGEGDRAGRYIAVLDSHKIVLYAHCDQILFFDGDSVRQGDDLATIGMTGNTTGPHAHIGTGIASSKGDRVIGGIRFKMIDPVEWYMLFKNQK